MPTSKILPQKFKNLQTKVTNLDTSNTRITDVINRMNNQKLKEICKQMQNPI